MKKKDEVETPVIENRKARFSYHIHETVECGIVLDGAEVKSVRDGQVSIAEGYVRPQISPPGLFIHSMNIADYAPAGPRRRKPDRVRKLLAHKREIMKLAARVEEKGFTIIPLKLYFKNGYAKLLVGVGEGKDARDKREDIKKRDADRDIRRAMSKRVGP